MYSMRLPFNGNFKITQEFGNKLFDNGKDYYLSMYNYTGHNGQDWGLPVGTPLYAPHSGEVKEVMFDETGYGWYVKIENDVEGSVLAHMNFVKVQVGFMVMEGDEIGTSGASGKVFGAHLHWGYYRIPRNRGNGTNGFIDQRPFEEQAGLIKPLEASTPVANTTITPPTTEELAQTLSEKVVYTKTQAEYDAAIADKAKFWKERDEARGQLEAAEKELEIVKGQNSEHVKELEELKKQPPTIVQETNVDGQAEIKRLNDKIEEQIRENNRTVTELEELRKKYDVAISEYQKYKDETEKKLNDLPVATNEEIARVLDIVDNQKKQIAGLTKEIKTALQRSETLAKQLAKKDKEDYTAIEIGLKAMGELENIRQAYQTKNIDKAKRAVLNIVSMVKNIRFIFVKPQEENKVNVTGDSTEVKVTVPDKINFVTEVVQDEPSTLVRLAQMLGL